MSEITLLEAALTLNRELVVQSDGYKEHLKTSVTRIENLYRLIYGHVNNGEILTAKEEYIAERYCIDTLKLLADENGNTGLPCRTCQGEGYSNEPESCDACGGTGFQFIPENA